MKKYICFTFCRNLYDKRIASILERPELTKPLDETYGKTDNEYRLYVNEAYPCLFCGVTTAGCIRLL